MDNMINRFREYESKLKEYICDYKDMGNEQAAAGVRHALHLFIHLFPEPLTPVRPPPNPSNREGTPAKEQVGAGCG